MSIGKELIEDIKKRHEEKVKQVYEREIIEKHGIPDIQK